MSTSFKAEEQDLKTFFPDPIIVKIADKDKKDIICFTIEEFTFENRVKFLKIISSIFIDVSKERPNLDKSGNIETLMALIEIAGDRMADIYTLILDRDIEWIKKNITLKKEIEILTSIFEVNDIPLLIGQIQKMFQKAVK